MAVPDARWRQELFSTMTYLLYAIITSYVLPNYRVFCLFFISIFPTYCLSIFSYNEFIIVRIVLIVFCVARAVTFSENPPNMRLQVSVCYY